MRVGVGPLPLERDPSGAPLRETYARALGLAELAESLGLDSIWVDGNHFTEEAHGPSPLLVLAALAARTRRIAIGAATVTLTLGDHPLHVAEEALVVDALSGGRLTLGVGLGYRAEEFLGFGVESEGRRERFDRALALIESAFDGDGVRAAADSAPAVTPWPAPVRSGGPPIWVGGGWSPAAVRRVARPGRPLISQFFEDERRIARKVELYREAAGPSAPGSRCVPAIRDVVVGRAESAAEVLLALYRRYAAWGMPLLGRPTRPDELDVASVLQIALVGSEEEIEARLARLASAGVTDVLARVDLPGLSATSVDETTRALARIRGRLEARPG